MSNKKLDDLNEIRDYIGEVKKIITQNNSKYIIAYCRVSDPKQINNYSIDTQLKEIKRYADENGFKIIKKFEVLGESSRQGRKRPSINELLDFIKSTNHKIHSIVVFHSNRFTRDGGFGADFLDKIIKKGIGFIDLNYPNDIFTPEGRLRQINAFYGAEQDNLTRKKFIDTTTLEKLKEGYTMRKVPLGYTSTKIGTGKSKKQKIIINKDGKKLKQAFKLKLTTNYSNVLITEKLKALGLDITPKHLGKIFKNVYYCGLVKDKRLIDSNGIIEGRHKGIITLEEYKIINNVNGARKRTVKKTDRKELPLRTHIICSSCNSKITGFKSSDRENLFYYRCATTGCKVSFNNQKLHDLYTNLLNDLSFDSKYIPQLSKLLKSIFKDINESNIQLKREISKSIGEIKKERFSAIKNMNSNPDKSNLFFELIDNCDENLKELNTQLDNVRNDVELTNDNINEILQFVSDLPNIWNKSDLITKVNLQELIFPDGILYNKKSNNLIPKNINPIFSVFGGFKDFIESNKDLNDTCKLNQKNTEISTKNQTKKIMINLMLKPINSDDCNVFDYELDEEKIPLELLLSDRSNNFTNKLVKSMEELLRFISVFII